MKLSIKDFICVKDNVIKKWRKNYRTECFKFGVSILISLICYLLLTNILTLLGLIFCIFVALFCCISDCIRLNSKIYALENDYRTLLTEIERKRKQNGEKNI